MALEKYLTELELFCAGHGVYLPPYNPTPHQATVNFCLSMNIEPPEKPLFTPGNVPELCSVCGKVNAHSKGFGQCPACFYENFNCTVDEWPLQYSE